MELEIIFKIITTILGILGVGKIFYEITNSSKARLRDEYRFSKDFLNDIAQDKKLHPFSIEKGYQAIAGTSEISKKEVSYLLSLENPCRCVSDYVFARDYLEHIETDEKSQIIFANNYKNKFYRIFLISFNIAKYFICAFLALSPFLFPNFFGSSLYHSTTYFIITLPFFGYFAFTSVQSFSKLIRSEKLVKNQNKHTKLIISK
ncbi:MAG: hypothetical protein KUA37_01950 [Desulfomicrobium sp.]|nr:hypothetical protein [Pseudomonadota bacterium]MBV1710754.1 hypothetical protein [Desulfomicrobium sp.]MBU4570362.1 hypothetical protein [Pseudomonadota bacterium]MBU4593283.1 hypothetical protein [Pseudomonadota bacterium]MBV1719836.1 hypothetical protein [Desulfomicrobium sp.]